MNLNHNISSIKKHIIQNGNLSIEKSTIFNKSNQQHNETDNKILQQLDTLDEKNTIYR